MKIGVISTPVFACPPVGYSGLEMVAWQQAEGLAERGHDVTLFAPEGSRCDHAKLFSIGPTGSWDEHRAYDAYWKQLLGFDAIIDNSWQKWAYTLKEEGRLQCALLGPLHAPVDTMYRELPQVEKPCFVCISEDQAAHFRALHSRDVRVARHGVDLNYYKSCGAPRTKRFLFLARFSKIKGASIAIDACRQAGVGLDLVGDTSITNEPDYLEECRKKCDVWPIGGNRVNGMATTTDRDFSARKIVMVGPAYRGECVRWFSQAHTLVHANKLFREPFGLAPVEAMACGTPCIAWDFGAMRETIKHGETGLLVKSFDDLVNAVGILRDKSDHAMGVMRADCRAWVESFFPLDKMILRYEELISESLQTGGW